MILVSEHRPLGGKGPSFLRDQDGLRNFFIAYKKAKIRIQKLVLCS